MKTRAMHLTEGNRNTHSSTMAIALRKISDSDMKTLQSIATDLERGLRQQKLNQQDAGFLLGKVRLEIAARHFH